MHVIALYSLARVSYPYDSSSLRLLITFFIDQEILPINYFKALAKVRALEKWSPHLYTDKMHLKTWREGRRWAELAERVRSGSFEDDHEVISDFYAWNLESRLCTFTHNA